MKRRAMGRAKKKNEPFQIASLRLLVKWFNRSRRVLPWREDPSLYRVWISEIMLQQTQVITVLPFFDRFMTIFPNVETLARAPEEKVLKAWEGLGYYSRARNLHRAAKQIVSSGDFPRTKEAWLEIPGVGPYTAGAITSIALGLPEPIVDGNVERVFARLRRLDRSLGETKYKEKLWELSRTAVTAAFRAGLSPSELNQAWMELGATLCTPRAPQCERCPIRTECHAEIAGEVSHYPTKKKRAEWLLINEVRNVYLDLSSRGGPRVYLEKTAKGEWREGLWDFPASKQPGLKAESLGHLETKHVVTRHKIKRRLNIYKVGKKRSEKNKLKISHSRWVLIDDPEVPVSSAPKKGMQAVRERFLNG